MAKDEQEKKLIIDEDWKQEAQKEKETLAEEEKKQAEETQQRGPLPPGNLAALISMLATQAMFAMGVIQIKGQDKREPDLEMAKYNIDMLGALEEKTKGNLNEQEEKVLSDTLSQLRMAYVEISNSVK